ncbi:MAG TPA: hypothetical protein VMG12_19280 [Polyangiaceae bacterium]|nr:hypothetical protein [Polyangiaceae bacterium]
MYVAIGSAASQRHVVHPSCVTWPVSSPLAMAASPSGTLISNVYEARSRGCSLAGNQLLAERGSPATIAPSGV